MYIYILNKYWKIFFEFVKYWVTWVLGCRIVFHLKDFKRLDLYKKFYGKINGWINKKINNKLRIKNLNLVISNEKWAQRCFQ